MTSSLKYIRPVRVTVIPSLVESAWRLNEADNGPNYKLTLTNCTTLSPVVQTDIFNAPFTPAVTPGQSTSMLLRPCPLTPVPDTLYFASTISHEAEARTGEGQHIVKRRLAVAAGAALLLLLAAQSATPSRAEAYAPQPSQWEQYRTPTHEDLLILPGSDIISFDIAGSSGETIYAIGAWNAPSGCIENSCSDDNISGGAVSSRGHGPPILPVPSHSSPTATIARAVTPVRT